MFESLGAAPALQALRAIYIVPFSSALVQMSGYLLE
jgi:hypothetical protein